MGSLTKNTSFMVYVENPTIKIEEDNGSYRTIESLSYSEQYNGVTLNAERAIDGNLRYSVIKDGLSTNISIYSSQSRVKINLDHHADIDTYIDNSTVHVMPDGDIVMHMKGSMMSDRKLPLGTVLDISEEETMIEFPLRQKMNFEE